MRSLSDAPDRAAAIARRLDTEGQTIWLTRSLEQAKIWARQQRVGQERMGLIASGQGRRLGALGLFVDLKPNIADWMLMPSGDPRSSNMLETVQNQYQVQGLEMDYAIVCWDADLRHSGDRWTAFRLNGADWQRDKALEIATSGYRVLLTRARKGMAIFIPAGDESDPTRQPEFFDGVVDYLKYCGCKLLPR
jgi:Uncharacterized conserved protein (DUF2075)